MEISEKIRFLRTNIVNLSQEAFAKKINVTRTTIKNWENGTSTPTVSHILLISLLCNVSTDYLIGNSSQYCLSLYGINDKKYFILSELISFFDDYNHNREKMNEGS